MDDHPLSRPIAATLVLLGCASVVTAHLATLYTSGLDPASTPLGTLSRGEDGNLHRLGLWLFALAHVALAVLLHRPDARRPTRAAQLLLLVDAALVVYLNRLYGAAGTHASYAPRSDVPEWLLAGGTAIVMALLLPELLHGERRAGLWNLACLLAWLALMPLYLVVEPGWFGTYERLVGAVFVTWMAGLAVLIGFGASHPRH